MPTQIVGNATYTYFQPGTTTETVINPGPAVLLGVIADVGTGTVTIRDASTASASTNIVSTANPGVAGRFFCNGIHINNGITLQLGTGTDKVILIWQQIY